jgi:hypothetical protein
LQVLSTRAAGLQKQLNEEGRDAEAIVTRHWRSSSKDHRTMLDYKFEADGRTYHKSVGAPGRNWNELRVGSPLAIRFLPSDPSQSHPRDWPVDRIPWWTIPLVIVSMSSGGVIIRAILRRQLSLLREGRPAPGVITRHSYAGNNQKTIHYNFVLLDGSVASGKTVRQSRNIPPVGATVCVIYDPGNSRRNSLYPMDVGRIAGPSDSI